MRDEEDDDYEDDNDDAYVIRHWTDSIYHIYLGIYHHAQQLERAIYLFACLLTR